MYEQFYDLRERPFDLTPNPRYLLLTPTHAEALSTLEYGVKARKGIVVLIGDAGTGKTTIVRAARASLGERGRVVLLNNPTLTPAEFCEFLAKGFRLSDQARATKVRLIEELTEALEGFWRDGVYPALVVDEAHRLPYELLEEIRLLSNIETDTTKLLPVVLAGQTELTERLNGADLRQLKQRVALRCTLRPLELHETATYIAGRVGLAGSRRAQLFTRQAMQLIHERSQGIPRTISVICDNALMSGFATDQKLVTCGQVLEVCRDLDLKASASTSIPAVNSTSSEKQSQTVLAPVAAADRTRQRQPREEKTAVNQSAPGAVLFGRGSLL